VDHLVENHDVIGSLEKLNVVVVRAWRHRRAGVESQDATHPQATWTEILDKATRSRRVQFDSLPPFGEGVLLLLRLRGQRRNSSIRWIDDERGALGSQYPLAPVVPEVVVVADVAGGHIGIPIVADVLLPLELGGLDVVEDGLPAQVLRPFKRGHRAEVPHALQIGCAPRSTRHSLCR